MDFDLARETMVNSQIRTVDVTDSQVIAAFLKVRREAYVPAMRRHIAYCDGDIALDSTHGGRALPNAGAWARLVQLLAPAPDDRILMVGSAGGYGAAVLARLVRQVVAIEADSALAEASRAAWRGEDMTNIELREGNLAQALSAQERFERIIVEGAIEFVPDELPRRLTGDGRLVAVVGAGRSARACLFIGSCDNAPAQPKFDVALPRLPGFDKQPQFEFAL